MPAAWSNCRLRQTAQSEDVNWSARVGYMEEWRDLEDAKLSFYSYVHQPLAQNEPELPGGPAQTAFEGARRVRRHQFVDEGTGKCHSGVGHKAV